MSSNKKRECGVGVGRAFCRKEFLRAGGVAPVIQCLLFEAHFAKHKSLSSNSSPQKNKNKKSKELRSIFQHSPVPNRYKILV
jgi:hypothetical protein